MLSSRGGVGRFFSFFIFKRKGEITWFLGEPWEISLRQQSMKGDYRKFTAN